MTCPGRDTGEPRPPTLPVPGSDERAVQAGRAFEAEVSTHNWRREAVVHAEQAYGSHGST